MSTSYTRSESETFSLTSAKYLASRVATELNLMRVYYGRPTEAEISDYVAEATILMKERLLQKIEYGFKRGGEVVLALQYEMQWDGSYSDDRPGSIPYGMDLSGASWYSYLTYSSKWSNMSGNDKSSIASQSPVKRSDGASPTYGGAGGWNSSKSFSKDGGSLARKVYGA